MKLRSVFNIQYEVLIFFIYIFKTTFASLEIKFLTIQPLIPLTLETIDKIVGIKCIIKTNLLITFLIYFFGFPLIV